MNKLMCHVVAGYPTPEKCLALMKGMQTLGVAAIEVQIPFSDPIADGPTIMRANDVALEQGMTTASGFELIKTARQQGVKADIYVMSYLQKVQHFGFAAFCQKAAACQVSGLIVPDLPYDSPDFAQLQQQANKHELVLIPVLSPGMAPERLQAILQSQPSTLYVTSRRGITGKAYADTQELHSFVATIKAKSKATIMIGFGIAQPADVAKVLQYGDMAVVGSALIRQLDGSSVEQTLQFIESLVHA